MSARSQGFLFWVERWWAGEAGPFGALLSVLLLPAELLVRGVVLLRNRAFDRGWSAVRAGPIPVVSVGNLVVGGSGKTPFTARLARNLAAMGHRPAIVLRGYGRDEVELHRRWLPEVPVVVSPRRLDGVRKAHERGCTVALLDDGFQHRALYRELDLVLVAVEDPFPPRLLPRGPYREPLRSLRRADGVILTRKSAPEQRARQVERRLVGEAGGVPTIRVRLGPGGWMDLEGSSAPPPEGSLLAVASVARPGRFLAMVREDREDLVACLSFPDHHEYDEDDVEEIVRVADGRTVVTTEKDAVKLVAFSHRLPEARVLRLTLEVEEGGDVLEALLGRISNSVTGAEGAPE